VGEGNINHFTCLCNRLHVHLSKHACVCHRLPSHETNERAVENQTIAVFDSDETRPQSSPVNFGRPGMFVDLACACFRRRNTHEIDTIRTK
jgi:hypothetical protein